MSDPGDDTLRQSQAPGMDSARVDSFCPPEPRSAERPGGAYAEQRAGEQPEVQPPVPGGPVVSVPAEVGDAEPEQTGWPAESSHGERVDHGGCTVADAIRSAMARRS
ncbi:hypothetical protein [Amycolatopsis silviterrae]|uniref:Uncharacterized protein n=1 Tax=Amycolatopsis silviterrae TaxID=1656914 RepID=A0ABW5H8G7_9PSEU